MVIVILNTSNWLWFQAAHELIDHFCWIKKLTEYGKEYIENFIPLDRLNFEIEYADR